MVFCFVPFYLCQFCVRTQTLTLWQTHTNELRSRVCVQLRCRSSCSSELERVSINETIALFELNSVSLVFAVHSFIIAALNFHWIIHNALEHIRFANYIIRNYWSDAMRTLNTGSSKFAHRNSKKKKKYARCKQNDEFSIKYDFVPAKSRSIWFVFEAWS